MCDLCRRSAAHRNHKWDVIVDLASAEKSRVATVTQQCDTLSQMLSERALALSNAETKQTQSTQIVRQEIRRVVAQLKAAIDERGAALERETDQCSQVRAALRIIFLCLEQPYHPIHGVAFSLAFSYVACGTQRACSAIEIARDSVAVALSKVSSIQERCRAIENMDDVSVMGHAKQGSFDSYANDLSFVRLIEADLLGFCFSTIS